MKTRGKTLIACTLLLALSSCATTKGAVIGGGIGAIAGDAGKGAAVGASVGAVVDIID